MGLIKSPNVPLSASPFSMADIETAARGMLQRARNSADALLAAAQTEGAQLKIAAQKQGHAEGHAKGLAQGLEEGRKTGHEQALTELKAALEAAMAALNSAASTLNAQRIELEASGLRDVVKLAIAIARRVTKRQGMLEPDVLVTNLEEAMKRVVQGADIRVALHPSQRQTLDAALPRLSMQWPALKHVEIIEDALVSPGGCRINTRQGVVDADLDAQLDRVAADLLPTPEDRDAAASLAPSS